MTERDSRRSAVGAALAGLGLLVLSGCALLQPPPVPRFGVPSGNRFGVGVAACTADISRAHAALAAAGAAAGDPAATAAAHAAAAGAMSAYHACLAGSSQP